MSSPKAERKRLSIENAASERSIGGVHTTNKSRTASSFGNASLPSLVHLCRKTIVSNLERFPPEAFDIIDPVEWAELVKLRFENTKPKRANKEASGSIDGRLVPVVTAKYLRAFEECNPHLADSIEADELLWKYCVEFKFRRGGLTRPDALQLPWPKLVERVRRLGEALLEGDSTTVTSLRSMPMSLSLLRDSGVGKLAKKAIKRSTTLDDTTKDTVKDLIASWMKIAEEDSKAASNNDLSLAESCATWRDLHNALTNRNDQVRNTQGQRMREIRKNVRILSFVLYLTLHQLANTRPKLVKVRPATAKQQAILAGMNSSKAAHAQKGKIAMIQNEAKIKALRQQRVAPKRKAAFGEAVAFASGTKKGAAFRRQKAGGTVHRLDDGQRFLKMPNKPLRTTKKK